MALEGWNYLSHALASLYNNCTSRVPSAGVAQAPVQFIVCFCWPCDNKERKYIPPNGLCFLCMPMGPYTSYGI
jgi:hypothetical protein